MALKHSYHTFVKIFFLLMFVIVSTLIADTNSLEFLVKQTEQRLLENYGENWKDVPLAQWQYARSLSLAAKYKKAAEWYLKSAQQGFDPAQSKLGIIYEQGEGVEQNYKEAVKWHLKAAEQDNVDSMQALGVIFFIGLGEIPENVPKALKWCHKASETGEFGCSVAEFILGNIYHAGEGVVQDYQESIKWYLKAAESGHVSAQQSLGVRYNNGGEGVDRDYKQAFKWFQRAARQGDTRSQFYLAQYYNEGKGITQDYMKAHMWANLAGAGGNDVLNEKIAKKARELRDRISKNLTPAQVLKAQQLAREWEPVDEAYEIMVKRMGLDSLLDKTEER